MNYLYLLLLPLLSMTFPRSIEARQQPPESIPAAEATASQAATAVKYLTYRPPPPQNLPNDGAA
jgi:hypothetical protein